MNGQPLCKIKRSDFGFPWPVKPSETKTKKETTMKYTYDEKGIRTDAPEWFKRLHAEWDEVRERRKRLQSFLADGEKTDKVSGAQLVLLNKQLEAMKEYSDILYVRISLANDEFAIEKDPVPMLGSPNYEVEV